MKWWEQDSNTAVIKFYGEIYRWWNDANDFTNTFQQLDGKYRTIIIKVHCYGGFVLEGNVIQHYITNAKAEVIVEIEGVAASMGSLLILGAKRIKMAQNGYIMIHEPIGAVEGNERQFFEAAKHLKSIKKNAIAAYVARTKKPTTDFEKMFDGADHWISADEALAMGLVDEIIPSVVTNVNDLTKDTVSKAKIEDIYNRFAASLSTDTIIPNNNPNNSNMKKDLIEKFGLQGVTEQSSDTAVLTAMAAKVTGLETTLANLSKGQIAALITAAEVSSGRKFSPAQLTHLQTIGEKAGVESLQAALAFIKPETAPGSDGKKDEAALAGQAKNLAAPITNLIKAENNDAGGEDRTKWTFSDWSEKDEKGLKEMREKNQAQYVALYKAEYNKEPVIK